MKNQNEQILIVGKPSLKLIPLFTIALGVVLLLITIFTGWSWDDFALVMYFISPVIILFGIVLYIYAGMCSITVTNLRVYGKSGFGTRVDLPFDMISAVGTITLWNGILVSTSSGYIRFMYIENSSEIHSIISKMLLDRQNDKKCTENNFGNADELKKYKELLDSGIITQEEFDAKKKQLLGL